MARSRLALVTLDYPPDRGGVARYLGSLVHASDGGLEVFVPNGHSTNGPGRVMQARMLSGGWPAWRPMIWFLKSLRQRGYEGVLISQVLPVGTAAWIVKLFGGLPYAVILHGLDFRLALRSRRKAWLLRRILRNASSVIANSNFTANEIRQFDSTITPLVLTPGLEPQTYPSRDNARQKLGLAAEERIILAVTRLVPRKGLDQLIAAMADLSQLAQLVVIGDGLDRERLGQLAHESGRRVRFLTNAEDAERDLWYAAADVFALPVRDEGTDVEGFGIVYLEAQAAGLPVVAGRSGGAPEALVDGETGFVVDPNDARALAEVLRKLLEDGALRRSMGEAGKHWVTGFRWEDRWRVFEQAWKKAKL